MVHFVSIEIELNSNIQNLDFTLLHHRVTISEKNRVFIPARICFQFPILFLCFIYPCLCKSLIWGLIFTAGFKNRNLCLSHKTQTTHCVSRLCNPQILIITISFFCFLVLFVCFLMTVSMQIRLALSLLYSLGLQSVEFFFLSGRVMDIHQ